MERVRLDTISGVIPGGDNDATWNECLEQNDKTNVAPIVSRII